MPIGVAGGQDAESKKNVKRRNTIMALIPSSELRQCAASHLDETRDFLLDLLRVPSVHGREAEAQRYIGDSFRKIGCKVRQVPIREALCRDPEYSHPDQPVSYAGRPNILVLAGGRGKGRSIILNTHVDVVPAGSWATAFDPTADGDYVVGRGAVDCKGQIAALYLLFRMMKELGVEPRARAAAQIVVEEEIGGNGTLSLIRQGQSADGVVVLEATDLTVCPANRGAIWFRATVQGKPVHMARKTSGVSAIDKSVELIRLLYGYEARLAEESKGQPLFAEYEQPVQVNVGRLTAGDWPSTVPGLAVMEGGVGFLPNKDIGTIKRELLSLAAGGDEWLAAHTTIEFPALHNDSYQIPVAHPLVLGMAESCRRVGIQTRIRGLIASCDARLFNKVGGMPTIVFGAGSIEQAHSNGERVKMGDVALEACALYDFVRDWCGFRDLS